MRSELREKLNTEITRKQFLQYLGVALLMLFGIHNFLALLSESKHGKHSSLLPNLGDVDEDFGVRKFGI